ncbi:MAG: hypothetical protein Q7W30_09980 [Coriobacteriia bacterium]|nr:hypothetical protein [Coriobacteriia bacterium]
MPPIRHAYRAVIRLVGAALILACLPSIAAAASPGTNGWYWPTGHSVTSAGGGWLQYRIYTPGGEAWHVAWDDCGPVHEPVYAAGWGVVDFADMHVSGYGWDARQRKTAPGGAIVIKYRTSTGEYFKALYGHLDFREADLPVGSIVRPGQQIAVTTAYSTVPHVHFAVHLGPDDPVPLSTPHQYVGMLMGHTHEFTLRGSTKVPTTYGFTDPVAFLLTRRPWVAPPASVATPTVPAAASVRSTIRIGGSFAPTAPAGARNVQLHCEQLVKGTWVRRTTFTGMTVDTGGAASRYVVSARFITPGQWRVRAYFAGDLDLSSASSGWAYLTVR